MESVDRRAPVNDGVLARALAAFPEASLVTDADQAIVFANQAFLTMTGYELDELLGRNCRLLQGPDTDQDVVDAVREALAAGRPWQGHLLNHRKDGTPFWNALAVTPLHDELGRISHFCSEQRDVTEDVETQRRTKDLLGQVTEQRETARMLLGLSEAVGRRSGTEEIAHTIAAAIPRICEADRSAIALWYLEERRLTIVGHSGWPTSLAGQVSEFETSPEDAPELAEILESGVPVLVDHRSSEWARRMLDAFAIRALIATPFYLGQSFAGLVLAHWVGPQAPDSVDTVLEERMSGLAGLTAVAFDNARLLEEARWRASHDPLTELPNRERLETVLEEALRATRDHGQGVGVLYCDVDRFKRTNDDLGHRNGDAVLVEVGRRLSRAVRDTDTVARAGGDEFVVVLPAIHGRDEAEAVAARIRGAMTDPAVVGDQLVPVRLSVGVAVSDGSADDVHEEADRLLRAADLAMYREKSAAPGLDTPPLADDLREALAAGTIDVAYQPQVDLATGSVVSVEALARWQHPSRGPLPPAVFIPVAEAAGLVHALGMQVLDRACSVLAELRASRSDFELAVNVAPSQLHEPTFVPDVASTVARHGVPPGAITLEITESTPLGNLSNVSATLLELRQRGFRIAMDDFGTGFASLTQLHDLPITDLKIDRTFVQDGPRGEVLVGAISDMARALGARVVAEGIESEQDLRMVRARGCDRAQGYFLGRATSADALHEGI
ncbi:bifunctional diguanylate cyclase/phosphodiesterase [Curtobacterium sp. MCBD17_021]|uniref:bifunctional diguanylate cyclase/phosphodiesterase n=1 Tax=Curtobacterium sp. MCBD17_021 TaxID=2175665 RepID=UPI0015E87F94|nr:bifunctional diguanylate cyclase/phosphodiesterase [Curtobacterium sp. MCBD17_021]